MANPKLLIEEGHLDDQNLHIDNAMDALYQPDGHGVVHRIPTDEHMLQVFQTQLSPFLLPNSNDAFSLFDIYSLITHIVLYDASLDERFGLQEDLPTTYHPHVLIEEICHVLGENSADYLYNVEIDENRSENNQWGSHYTHILHWASERLLPYFGEMLGRDFVITSQDKRGNTYLHSYLESAVFRILNPLFVAELLDNGFHPLVQNKDGETALHTIVYISDHPFAHLTQEDINADSRAAIRYRRFYQTMVEVFKSPDGDITIKNEYGYTVREMLYDMKPENKWVGEYSNEMNDYKKHYWPTHDLHNAREAYEITIGRPLAIERAKQQKLANAFAGNRNLRNKSMNLGPPTVPLLPMDVSAIIQGMLGTNLKRGKAVVEKKHKRQINNTRRRKQAMHNELQSPTVNNTRRKQEMLNELLSRKKNRSGGRRTRRAKK